MSNLVLSTFAAADTDYVANMNADNRAIEAAVNTLRSLVQNTFGDGALLLDDLFEFDGIVGEESFQLDIPAYMVGGAGSVTIGRRPAPAYGEEDSSVAYMTASGERVRVVVEGDQAVSAEGITDGLPKTIYLVLTSGGDVQFIEDADLPNYLYLYSACWNGYTLTEFKRMARIIPGYSLFKRLAAPMIPIQIFDPETNFIDVDESETMLTLHGMADENDPLLVPASMEVLGGFITFNKAGLDGASAPWGEDDDVKLELDVIGDEGETWNEETIQVQVDTAPLTVFWRADPELGALLFVNEFKEFRLSRASIGANVLSARAFTWGLYVRPILGAPVARDTDAFDLI